MPTFSVVVSLGMLFAMLNSIVESLSDYYACTRLSGAPPPPAHAVNRAVLAEGTGSLLAGLIGSGSSTTSATRRTSLPSPSRRLAIRLLRDN